MVAFSLRNPPKEKQIMQAKKKNSDSGKKKHLTLNDRIDIAEYYGPPKSHHPFTIHREHGIIIFKGAR